MESEEREISLVDLFWKVMMGWKAWLTCGIVFAVLLAGVSYLRSLQSYRTQLAEWETLQNAQSEDGVSDLTMEEEEEVRSAAYTSRNLISEKQYFEESILMQLDPYQENVLTLLYTVTPSDETTGAETVATNEVAAYVSYAQGGGLAEEIGEALGLDTDVKYLNELISVTYGSPNITNSTTNSTMVITSFTIRFIYDKAEDMEAISGAVQEALQSQVPAISETLGDHTLTLVSETITVEADTDLAKQQIAMQEQISKHEDSLDTMMTDFTDAQKLLVTGAQEEAGGQQQELAQPTAASVDYKYPLIGFVLGVFLVAAWIFCKSAFSSRLQSTDELEQLYHLRLLGVLQNRREAAGLDRLLLNIKNRNHKQISEETEFRVMTSNLELICKANDVHSLFLTGTEIERMSRAWVEQFTARMKESGVDVVYGENVCYDEAALRKAAETGCAVLVEMCGGSIYSEIEKEIKTLTEQKVTILGCIGDERTEKC